MGDKDKSPSIIDKLADAVSTAVGNIANKAVMPTADTKAEATAERTNEQMFLGDAAIAPEAVPAPVRPRRRKAGKPKTGKTNKAGAAKKVAPKVTKRRAPKKTRSSTHRKGAGKKKAGKNVAARKRSKTR